MIPRDIILNENDFIYYDTQEKKSHEFIQSNVHYHNYYELFYLEYGECTYSIENTVFTLHSNQLVLVSPLAMHITNYEQRSLRKIISFSSDFIDPIFTDKLLANNAPYIFFNDKSKIILNLFENIKVEMTFPDDISKKVSKSYLTIILHYILRNPTPATYFINDTKSHSPVQRMLDYVQTNYQKEIGLKDLSEYLGYTPNYISKIFSNATGVGFKKYLFMQRMKAAEALLIGSNMSMTEIAYAVGFNDSNYFSIAFKNKHGVTPTEYKKSIKTV